MDGRVGLEGPAEAVAGIESDDFFRLLLMKADFEVRSLRTLDHVDPLDVAQEVHFRLLRKQGAGALRTTEPRALLRGLAGKMIRRMAIQMGRRAHVRKERRAPDPGGDGEGSAAALDRHESKGPRTRTRDRRIDAADRVRRILAFVAEREELDPRLRGDLELLILRHVDGLELKEIAERRERGETPEAVRLRLRRLTDHIVRAFPPPG
jgi:DNA-directed RNA polymerase specialized sigma24 family protein